MWLGANGTGLFLRTYTFLSVVLHEIFPIRQSEATEIFNMINFILVLSFLSPFFVPCSSFLSFFFHSPFLPPLFLFFLSLLLCTLTSSHHLHLHLTHLCIHLHYPSNIITTISMANILLKMNIKIYYIKKNLEF